MKKLLALVPAVSLLLSSAGYAQRAPAQPALYAEIVQDCAPWDGAAFTVAIQLVPGVKQLKPPVLHISIWQAANLPSGGRFQFPDATGRVGAVYPDPPAKSLTTFRGDVSFRSVVQGKDVEGQFDLVDSLGKRYSGKFLAKWNGRFAICGG
jgi:hypothetical protein